MKTVKIIFTLLFLMTALCGFSQQTFKITGKVLSSDNTPVIGAVLTTTEGDNSITDESGNFEIVTSKPKGNMSIWAVGFYQVTRSYSNNENIVVLLIPEDKYKYNETTILPFRIEQGEVSSTSAINITKKDFMPASMTIDRALSGQMAGVRMTRMSGMPGEGSYMNYRGIRSLVAENSPLIVINGVPYLPHNGESQLLNGYTRNVFQAYNINDIQNITFLKGAEASLYGSMGSNGVILIETDGAASDDLETKISFYGQYGINWNKKRIPLMGVSDYTSYLSDIGMSYYGNMETFFSNFPFLSNDPGIYYYLYNNNTNWQNEIYRNSFVTDNLFRIEGGDAIAKYDISLGYTLENGILDNTSSERYHTQINTNILISKELELFTTMGLSYLNADLQEQGMIEQTNPVLAAYLRAPLLSPYRKDSDGNTLADYATYYYGNNMSSDFAVSNPLAIINTLNAGNRQFDFNGRIGLTYSPSLNLSFSGLLGIYYNYNQEKIFIPGLDNFAIRPFFDQYGEASNTVRVGVGETLNMFYNLNGRYTRTYNDIHGLNVMAGMQIMMSKNEYDAGSGRNTASDFYQTLDNVDGIGRYFYGYLEKWNWMNFYAHADYTYNQILKASLNLATDGASSTGVNANQFGFFPSFGLTWMVNNLQPFRNSTLLNRLNLRAEYGLTGNSRFSSDLGKYHYTSQPYQFVAGIIRTNIPNTKLKWEKHAQFNVGFDASLFSNRLDMSLDYYNTQSKDVVIAKSLASLYGTNPFHDNVGEIENKGLEFALQASLVRTKDFEWIVGGNIATNKSKVKSLGGANEVITTLSDGSQLITRVGETPYAFYGYEANGVIASTRQATTLGFVNSVGKSFEAGDVRYIDRNGDKIINDDDKIILGDATPDFFGGFYTHFRYKNFSLSAEFTYSKGNDAYNAVRRTLESVSTFGNQSMAVTNRWTLEGQVTDIPRATWNDPVGNNDFSSRWIEDASYLKLKNITFSYNLDKTFLKIFRNSTFYVTGENLFTATKYLGLDPEFSYSYSDALQGFDYAKVMLPRSIKFGVNLKF